MEFGLKKATKVNGTKMNWIVSLFCL